MAERDRLQKIMECEGLNAKQFSQEVGISAGTISNIMGGRNKPSLEVMQAIIRRFPQINCLWLVDGKGAMYVSTPDNAPRLPFPDENGNNGNNDDSVSNTAETQTRNAAKNVQPAGTSVGASPSTTAVATNPSQQQMPTPATPLRTVQKIVIFYSDGTFEER